MNKNTIIAIYTFITALSIGWALSESIQKKELAKKLDEKEKDYLKLFSKYIESNKDNSAVAEEIKERLEKLKKEYSGIDDAVANKLQTVIELIANKKEEIAIEKLTLIIENILKEKYLEETKIKKAPSLFKMLEKARDLKWITKHQFNFSLFIKDKRNQEAHELEPDINDNEKFIAFFSGIEIIYQLKGIKRSAA